MVFIFLLFLLILPACGPISNKVKKSQRQQVAGSSFVKPSEEEIRDDVRKEYAQKHQELTGGKEFVAKRKLSRKQRAVLAAQQAKSQEAKLVDIPIPLQAEPLEYFFADQQETAAATSLGYSVNMSVDELVAFYQREMDRHGWRCLSECAGKETLTSFVKPARVCSVSIRPRAKKAGTNLVIFTSPTA